MWRIFWLATLATGVLAVAVAATLSHLAWERHAATGTPVEHPYAPVFVLGGLLVVIAVVGNVALSAIEPRMRWGEGV